MILEAFLIKILLERSLILEMKTPLMGEAKGDEFVCVFGERDDE